MRKFILQESEKEQIRKMYGLVNEQVSPENNDEFMSWLETVTISAFAAPNPYKEGKIKLGAKITPYKKEDDAKYQVVKNLIQRLNVVTSDGKSVYQEISDETNLFNPHNDNEYKEIIGDSVVYYFIYDENSELVKNLEKYTNRNKITNLIVTVTPRPTNNIKLNKLVLFISKPTTLIVA
jgi:hypothetical protein